MGHSNGGTKRRVRFNSEFEATVSEYRDQQGGLESAEPTGRDLDTCSVSSEIFRDSVGGTHRPLVHLKLQAPQHGIILCYINLGLAPLCVRATRWRLARQCCAYGRSLHSFLG
jgi:hypothetical protein